jgi:hypothetical protein
MDNPTTRKQNGKSMGQRIGDETDIYDVPLNLSTQVGKACRKWLESREGYRPTSFSGRLQKPIAKEKIAVSSTTP